MTYRHPTPNIPRRTRAVARRFDASIKPGRSSRAVPMGICGFQAHQPASSKHSFCGQANGGRA